MKPSEAQDNDKPKGNNVAGPSVVNMVEHNNSSSTKGTEDGSTNQLKDDDVTWWVDSGATVHVYKDRFWFKTYESLNDGSILHMGNESTALMHGRGCVDLRLNIVSDNIGSAFMSTSKLNDSILWHARLGHVHFKRMQDMSKDGDLCDLHATPSLGNKKYFVIFIDDVSRFCYVNLLHSKDEALDKFKVFKTEFELQQGSLIKRFKTDRGGEYMDTLYFQSVGVIHETTALYTLQQNGISKRKNKVLKEMDNSMLSYSGLSQGLWGEALLIAYYLLNRVPNKRNRVTLYELWTKKKPNLNYLRVWGCRAVVRLPDPKLKTLGERGIECIFVGYAEHSKALRDAIFDGHRFSSVPRPSQRSLKDRTEDFGGSVVSERVTDEIVQQSEPELRKSKRHRTLKDFRPEFQLYLIEGTRDEVSDQHPYCFNVEDDPKTFDDAMKPLGCKWIFKRKLNVDGTVEKFKARLVIQGFKQKSGIDYFDTYALVARISVIRLLIALASIHSLIIHQMDMKTAFLNGELEEEVYINQPMGFILPGNENKVCKLVKSLYGLKQAPKQWHQKFDEVVLSNGYLLNQADKCVYSKFDESGKGVINMLYVDDNVDLCILDQSHYIEKVLKKLKVVGCLRYLLHTRPDLTYSVGVDIVIVVIMLTLMMDEALLDMFFYLGTSPITWCSQKQTTVALSSCEAEFMAAIAAACQAIWLRELLAEVTGLERQKVIIRVDNKSAIALSKNPVFHGRSKHIHTRYHFIRECVENEQVIVEHVSGENQRVNEGLGAHKVQGDEIVTWCARATLFDSEIQRIT
ncbi:zinc finger, CCHC-type containing protein [Tanacetum coccineum]